ncbi:MAG: hypothetical protein [Microviridae sp. ctjWc39]|nr:MAG: hypothetical protein [Microviridae sp. ctjWc39]QGH72366.1 MAG: hypothetical protein [Microviridae sp. ctGWf34]
MTLTHTTNLHLTPNVRKSNIKTQSTYQYLMSPGTFTSSIYNVPGKVYWEFPVDKGGWLGASCTGALLVANPIDTNSSKFFGSKQKSKKRAGSLPNLFLTIDGKASKLALASLTWSMADL